MKLFVSARRLREELAAARAESARLRDQRDEALKQRKTAEFNREQILRQLADASTANRRVSDRNLELGRRISQLTESDPEYAAELERKVAEVLEEHDVHRKALADALGDQKRHLGWDALIGEVGGLAGDLAATRRELAAVRKVEESLARQIHEMAQPVEPSDEEVDAAQLRLELDAERSRVKHLEKELDNALGMPARGILNSAPWQPGCEAPTPDKAVSP